jgi:curved DNA-binding protein CbpA
VSDYYALLNVAKDAPAAAIRSAYARLARESHPDRFPDPEEKKRAQDRFTEITAAFNTLSNEKDRREYDAALAAPKVAVPELIAREAFDRARQLMEAKAFHEAVELLRTAVHHQPREAAYHAALGQALSRNPHWAREAAQAIEQAIQLAPQRAQYHSQMAELLLKQGLKLRARRAAEMALRLNPGDRVAKSVMEATAQG